jgi:hypothetical protein
VVGAIAPQLEKAEIERAKRSATADPAAYDLYLRGLDNWNRWTKEANAAARILSPEQRNRPASLDLCHAHRRRT